MNAVVGVFRSSGEAEEAVRRLRSAGIGSDHVSLLTPGTPPPEIERRVPAEPGESPGMGAAVGGVVGGALGLTTAALVLPGVGPVVVAGMLAAGLAGAAGGGVVGDRIEDNLSHGLAGEELLTYRPLLQRGKSLVVAVPDTSEEADAVRAALNAAGAESVDGAADATPNRAARS